jgi:hypothetical protein
MGRLCERPGCSEPASVAYGMRAEDLVFWLDTLRPDTYQSSGVLCLRHAESMVVPRHWTLDDLRDPVPRLFRPPTSPAPPAPGRRRRRTAAESVGDQLLLTADTADDPSAGVSTTVVEPAEPAAEEEPPVATGHEPAHADREHGGTAEATPWTPTFDVSDDLNGLLAARSPLLARAFRGDDRPKPA